MKIEKIVKITANDDTVLTNKNKGLYVAVCGAVSVLDNIDDDDLMKIIGGGISGSANIYNDQQVLKDVTTITNRSTLMFNILSCGPDECQQESILIDLFKAIMYRDSNGPQTLNNLVKDAHEELERKRKEDDVFATL